MADFDVMRPKVRYRRRRIIRISDGACVWQASYVEGDDPPSFERAQDFYPGTVGTDYEHVDEFSHVWRPPSKVLAWLKGWVPVRWAGYR